MGRGARCKYHLHVAHGSAVETTEILEFLQELGEEVGDLIPDSIRAQALTFRLWQTSHG